MTPPTFLGRPLKASTLTGDTDPYYYEGRIHGVRVRVWSVYILGVSPAQWKAEAHVASVRVGSGDGKRTPSLALRSLLTELGKVQRKLGDLLERDFLAGEPHMRAGIGRKARRKA